MQYRLFIGVDSAKEKCDLALMDAQGEVLDRLTLGNRTELIQDWLDELSASFKVAPQEILCCIENTGWYHVRILNLLCAAGCQVWVEDAYQLSRSMGRVRGKTDKLDALRIAQYALRFEDQARLCAGESDLRLRLRSLVAQRRRIVRYISGLSQPIAEEQHCSPVDLEQQHQHSLQLVQLMRKQLKALEKDIDKTIKKDEKLARQRKIILSVPGFGPVTTHLLLIVTDGFTRYTTARQLASYTGVAPFSRQSGKCLNRKPKTSAIANKRLKSMLTMGARSLLRGENHFAAFYERKRKEGKPHLVALNAVRNKMIHTVCACLRNDVMYQKNYQISLQKP
jgi:transposase